LKPGASDAPPQITRFSTIGALRSIGHLKRKKKKLNEGRKNSNKSVKNVKEQERFVENKEKDVSKSGR
jgi:hypothetical protein